MSAASANAMSAMDARVVVLTPTAKDYALVRAIFARHDIETFGCPDLEHCCNELGQGAGALLMAEEFLANDLPLRTWLGGQPPWSDLPVLITARPGEDYSAVALAAKSLGNVTLLDRPTRVANLVSIVQSALRARARQYELRAHLAEQRRAAEQLRLNDQRKDEFLAILAHELRNPLAPISNGLQILNLAYGADDTAAVREVMERQLGNMKRLVDDLLEVSRVTRGQLELRVEQAELGAIVRSALELSAPLITAAQHRLEVLVPDTPVYLQADVVRLAQVIANLLNNAGKYTSPGGLIRLEARSSGASLEISVTDDGVGIPPELQPKIFDMFMQVDASRNRSQGGLGIGLTLVKRLVEMHGGSVDVQSAGVGRGSRFTVTLPLRSNPEAAHPGAAAGPERNLAGLRVMIADDNRDAADTLGHVLRRLGASVQVNYGGEEAFAALDLAGTDVAILDLGMPGLDGLALARRIRALEGGQDLQLIALTGWGQQQDMLNTRNAGFDHHLTKPVDLTQLLSLLRSVRFA